MFGRRFKLFRLLGFEVAIDPSWVVIAVLVTWSLAEGLFRSYFPEFGATARWTMGAAGALGLFTSIVLHELAHSLVARRYGVEMKGITLFIFGGVAEMGDEPPNPEAELMIAIAGPILSLALGGTLLVVGFLVWPGAVRGVLLYLGFMNVALVAFNMIPAFPLDGGRVLRSILWTWKRNLRWATRVTSRLGSWFGAGLIILAVVSVLAGNYIGGIWWFLLGMFLRSAAQMSYRQLVVRRALEGEPVRRFMQANPVTVEPGLTLDRVVEELVYRHHFKMFPVVEGDRLLGCVSTRQIKAVPRENWAATAVSDVAEPCSVSNTVDADADAMEALGKMSRSGASRLMVVRDGRLAGVISLKDLLQFISLKVELEE